MYSGLAFQDFLNHEKIIENAPHGMIHYVSFDKRTTKLGAIEAFLFKQYNIIALTVEDPPQMAHDYLIMQGYTLVGNFHNHAATTFDNLYVSIEKFATLREDFHGGDFCDALERIKNLSAKWSE